MLCRSRAPKPDCALPLCYRGHRTHYKCGLITPSVPPDSTQGISPDQLFGRFVQMLRQQPHQGLCEVAASKIVDATIALGLADDRRNIRGTYCSGRNQRFELRQIARMRHRQAKDICAFHTFVAFRESSNSRLGLSGISSNSTFFSLSCSASSIACANSGAHGIAPASPAPLIPERIERRRRHGVRQLHARHFQRGRQQIVGK